MRGLTDNYFLAAISEPVYVGAAASTRPELCCQNPSYEVDHLDKEYKGRNGTPEGVSKPDGLSAKTRSAEVQPTRSISAQVAFAREGRAEPGTTRLQSVNNGG
jgi:hypothetical protein